MREQLSSAGVYRRLILASALVALAGLLAEVLQSIWSSASGHAAFALFSLSHEGNVPTWYSSLLAGGAGVLLGLAARAAESRRLAWWGLAAGFMLISMDEVVGLHEGVSSLFDLGGVWYFGWVIPAALLVVVLAALYLPFLAQLEPATRRRFIVAGALYVTGAVLFELPLGAWTEERGSSNLGYGLIDWVEESLEIAGVTLFIGALIAHLWPGKPA